MKVKNSFLGVYFGYFPSISLIALFLCYWKLCLVKDVGTRSPVKGANFSWLRRKKKLIFIQELSKSEFINCFEDFLIMCINVAPEL